MPQLQSFHMFLQLPFEIRVQIWKMAFGSRMVRLTEGEEDEEEEDDDEYDEDDEERKIIESISETLAQQTKRQTREKQLALYDLIVESYRNTGWRKKQAQLEFFGFTSVHPPPKLRRVSPEAFNDETREGRLYSHAKVPALLVTCRESREVLKSLGYDFTFASRTRSAKTWFNYRLDVLELGIHYDGIPDEGQTSRTIDGGSWNIGQILPHDRRRVRRLALKWHPLELDALINGVKMFGALQEVLLVWKDIRDTDPGFMSKISDNKWDDEDQDFDFLDLGSDMYEMLQHCHCECHQYRPSDTDLLRTQSILQSSCTDENCTDENCTDENCTDENCEEWVGDRRDNKAIRRKLLEARDLDIENGGEYWPVPTVRTVVIMTLKQKQHLLEKRKIWWQNCKNRKRGKNGLPSHFLRPNDVPMYVVETQILLHMLVLYPCRSPTVERRSCCT